MPTRTSVAPVMTDRVRQLLDDLSDAYGLGSRRYHRNRARTHRERALDPEARAAREAAIARMFADNEQRTDLPSRQQGEPIIGWRFARVVREHDGWRFAALVNQYGTFAVEDEATCKIGRRHRAPAPGCTCGFYALNEKPPLAVRATSGEWLLEVELYGRVIAHRLGYRAQYQRVRSLLAGFCPCQEPATNVVVARSAVGDTFPYLALFCADHRPTDVPLVDFAHILGTPMRALVSEELL